MKSILFILQFITCTLIAQQNVVINRTFQYIPVLQINTNTKLDMEWSGEGTCRQSGNIFTIKGIKPGSATLKLYKPMNGSHQLIQSQTFTFVDPPLYEVALSGVFSGGKIQRETTGKINRLDLIESGKPSNSTIVGFDFINMGHGRACPASPVRNPGTIFIPEILEHFRNNQPSTILITNVVINRPDGTILNLGNDFFFEINYKPWISHFDIILIQNCHFCRNILPIFIWFNLCSEQTD